MAFVTYEYNKERIQMWKIVNADRWRDYQRNYMRERRAKVKAEACVPTDDVVTEQCRV